ncbi:MAG TPA: STAS domain-containing protein [Streptosporangiaceae bacterium]|nr:STAS domain-containing protein [Streptosporangiaceae bacterium]
MSDRHGFGELVVVPLPAEIDISNSESVGAELGAACASGAGVIIADLTSTAFCDSSGVRCLLLAHDEAAAHDAQLRLAVQPDGMVLRMLTLMGLHRVLQVHVSLDAATAA